jgi:hypothetical protein
MAPGQPKQMLDETIRHVKPLHRDTAQRANAFKAIVCTIDGEKAGAWFDDGM